MALTFTEEDYLIIDKAGLGAYVPKIKELQVKVDTANALWEKWNMNIETIIRLKEELKRLKQA